MNGRLLNPLLNGTFPPIAERLNLNEAGKRLRRLRERLGLKYRDVREASQRIAKNRGNPEFTVGLSRLADIENKGTIPSIYRLYSLCAVYGLNLGTVLDWYGADPGDLPLESSKLALHATRPLEFQPTDQIPAEFPIESNEEFERTKTSYITQEPRRWGKLPLSLVRALDPKRHSYALIGTEDWSMYPLIAPGAFVQIDDTKRKIVNHGWTQDFERPIYFLEARRGYLCRWCVEKEGFLIAQPHSSSQELPEILRLRDEVEVIGQVVGVAMRLDLGRRRRTHS